MDRTHIQKEINQLLQAFAEQFEDAGGHAGKIPQIEMDIMMSGIRRLYELLHQLNKINRQPSEHSFESEVVVEELKSWHQSAPMVEELETSLVDSQELAKEEKIQQPAPAKVENVAVEIPEIRNAAPSPQPATDPVQSKQPSNGKTVAGSFTGKTTLHDKMSVEKTGKSVASHLQSKPLADLKRSIGINEKFVFVNELFQGSQQQYNQSIDTLNNFSGYEQAKKHLMEELAGPMSWNTQGKAFTEFSEYIRRRFNG